MKAGLDSINVSMYDGFTSNKPFWKDKGWGRCSRRFSYFWEEDIMKNGNYGITISNRSGFGRFQ